MTAPEPTGERSALAAAVLPALATAVLSGLAVAAVVATGPSGTLAAWGGGVAAALLCAAVALAAHGRRTTRQAHRDLDRMSRDVDRLRHERGLREEEFARERARLNTELASQRTLLTNEYTHERERFTTEVTRLNEANSVLSGQVRQATTARDAAVSVIGNVAGRLQALATGMLAELRAMEERHTDEEVLADLLHLDHRTAQAGRLADSLAVLTGARSGRRWARPIAMESILRGAMGRISGYQRVRVHASSEAAVAGHAAEGVMHALAELLDNAANFSPPTAEVHVYIEEVPSGVIISVEDAGLVMNEVQLRRAEHAVSGAVTDLGGLSGTRLGLAVVGGLARKYGLRVSFRPSSRGGTGVLLLIPHEILTHPARQSAPQPAAAARPDPDSSPRHAAHHPSRPEITPSWSPAAGAAPEWDPAAGTPALPAPDAGAAAPPDGTGVLPRRRRGQALAAAEHHRNRTTATERQPLTPQDAKARTARFGSFRQAVRGTARERAEGRAPDTPALDPTQSATPHETADAPSFPEGRTTS
ncbi:sensor histidine kinase [Streptomyces sp. BBFR109]|uniref:sensor histidine kinase n=1 Tax=Streptomyces sp. BBFR109 TaxID=3448172 RepID=UPI003F76F928